MMQVGIKDLAVNASKGSTQKGKGQEVSRQRNLHGEHNGLSSSPKLPINTLQLP